MDGAMSLVVQTLLYVLGVLVMIAALVWLERKLRL